MTETESLLLVSAAALALLLKENPFHPHAETIRRIVTMTQDHLDERKTDNGV